MITRRTLVHTATAALLARPARAAQAESEVESGIVLVDSAASGRREYGAGRYLAFQAVNNRVLPRRQSLTVQPDSFPAATRMDWTWPADADDSAKGWNAIDYGDYLNTKTPVRVEPARIDRLTRLVVGTDMRHLGPPDGANAAIDLFLYRTPVSGIPAMLCEVQVFLHAPAATRRFIAGLTQLGTYVAPATGRTAPIRWRVAMQAANFFGTPYFLFHPEDGADRLALDLDLKALLDWLRADNPATGRRHLAGEAFFTGLGVGVEPLKGQGAAVIDGLNVEYNFEA